MKKGYDKMAKKMAKKGKAKLGKGKAVRIQS